MSKLNITQPIVGRSTGIIYNLLTTIEVGRFIRHVLQNTISHSVIVVDEYGLGDDNCQWVKNRAPVVTKRFLNVYDKYWGVVGWHSSRDGAENAAVDDKANRVALIIGTKAENGPETFEVVRP